MALTAAFPYASSTGAFQDAAKTNPTASIIESVLPNNVTTEDPFWAYAGDIDTNRWNQQFPYQLLILDTSKGGYSTVASYTLPIPPQELSVSTPFAITTQVTLGGIVEQHNGAPLRTISLSGTTGMWGNKLTGTPFQRPDVLQTIFAGTLNAASNLAQSVASIAQPFGNSSAGNVAASSDFNSVTAPYGAYTGYYQLRLLQQFLESYVTAKKAKAGSNLRLAFAIWKDQAVYLVTPASFDYRRTQGSPWEYTYNLSFRAWKRIDYDAAGIQPLNSGQGASTNNSSAIVQTLQAVAAAQQALQVGNLVAVLQGATGDAQNLLETMRSISAWGKDQVGQVYSLADLPDQIVNSLKGTIISTFSNPNLTPPDVNAEFLQLLQDLGVSSGKAQTQVSNPAGQGQNLNTLQGPDAAHSLNTIFANPKQYYQYFSTILIGDVSVPPSVQGKITAERQRVRAFTRQDFETMLASIQTSAEDFSDYVGAGDPTFNVTYNRTVPATARTPSDNDFDVMFQLNSMVQQLNRQAAYNNTSAIPTNPLDFAAGFFAETQIPFKSSPGKFVVPFPYGASLETLAIQYLNDIDRWEEIAVLNDLREPYVDETGFLVPLLTNGNGSKVVVASATNLAVNQLVTLTSNGQQNTQRHILSITSINNGSYFVLVLDGLPNLSAFTTAQNATIHAYLPGTINSLMTLYMPSPTPPVVPEFDTPGIPGVSIFQLYFNLGGVDLLLTSSGDLVITPDGDQRLAIGLTNLVQGAWLAFNTPKGNLKRHLSYGFPKVVGQSVADMPAASLMSAAKGLFKDDPSYSGVQYVNVNIMGPTARIFMGVGLANSSQILPISFDVR